MIQKIKNIIIAVFIGIFVLNACDLDRIPETDLSDGVFWLSEADFQQAVDYLYKVSDVSTFEEQFGLVADVMSDNAIQNPFNEIGNGTYIPTATFGPWNQDYRIIRAANNIIEKVNFAEFSSERFPNFIAEAKFFRAYAYADLVRRYGDVPLIMKTLDIDDEELYSTRASKEVVLDAIYDDLNDAATNLPTKSFGKVTQGAALALKSRVALRQGTWNKYHNTGDYIKHLQIAKEASLEVMQSGEYGLFSEYASLSYQYLFKIAGIGEQNVEAIWIWDYGFDDSSPLRKNYFSAKAGNGDFAVSRSLVDSYLCIDGLPIEKSPLYQGQQNATSEFENRDLRLNGTVVKKGDLWTEDALYIPNLDAQTGYYIQKQHDYGGTPGVYRYIDYIAIRYGEVLLNFAEASFELNDAISDADLDISINLLRDRVDMPHISNAFISDNDLNMREEIRRERRVELGMEGFRYDDLLRWKTAEVELPKAILGVKVFPDEYPGVDQSSLNLTQDGFIIVEPAEKRHFDAAKNYLWPIPLTELGLNDDLIQNPGW